MEDGGETRRMMPGGVGGIDDSIEITEPEVWRNRKKTSTGTNGYHKEDEARPTQHEPGREGQEDTKKEGEADNRGETRGRTRGRKAKLDENEHIPSIATTILTPIDARKYISTLPKTAKMKSVLP